MTAGKVQPSVQAKVDVAKRAVSEQASVKKNDFTKLLQAKKDGAQTAEKTEARKPDGAKADEKPVENLSADDREGQETAGTAEKKDTVQEEALQQAVLQQAAAQILIQPETVQEPAVEEAGAENILQAAEADVSADAGAAVPETAAEAAVQSEAAMQVQPKETVPVKAAEPKEERPAAEAAAEKPVTEPQPEKVVRTEERSDSGRHTEARQESETEVPVAAAGPETRTVRQEAESQSIGQETAYGVQVQTAGGTQEPSAIEQRTEQIPLKTTPEQLPQDLGKTLASKTFETARTLTVELEPASLGKLVIKLVYEGERASLSIMASNPRTLDILSQRASEIAAILEEKTGQETIIYTQPAQQGDDRYDEEQNQNRGREQGEPEQRQQSHGEEHHQAESFAQQLRLGLV